MLPDDEIKKQSANAVETFATFYINKYYDDVEKCKTIYDYYALIISVLVFRNLVVAHFSNEIMRQFPEEDLKSLIEIMENIATVISNNVISVFSEKTMN